MGSQETKPMERRALAPSELRAEPDGKIRGYAAVFNTWADGGFGYEESIRPGAFKKTLKEGKPDIRALWNHDTNLVLARTTNGTLTLWEDEKGLAVEIDPPDTSWGRDATESIRRGDVSGMSFGFRPIRDEWSYGTGTDGKDRRVMVELAVNEVSPCTFPWYESTEVSVRAALDQVGVAAETRDAVLAQLRGERNVAPEPPEEPQDLTLRCATCGQPITESVEDHSDEDTPEPGAEDSHSAENTETSEETLEANIETNEQIPTAVSEEPVTDHSDEEAAGQQDEKPQESGVVDDGGQEAEGEPQKTVSRVVTDQQTARTQRLRDFLESQKG